MIAIGILLGVIVALVIMCYACLVCAGDADEWERIFWEENHKGKKKHDDKG